MTVAVPAATPVNVAVQCPDDSVQLIVTVPTAVFDEVKPTAPVGVLEAVVVSVTVAVHVDVPAGATEAELHETAVEVLSFDDVVTATVAIGLVLMLC